MQRVHATSRLELTLPRPVCPWCRAEVGRAETKAACPDCLTWLHAECASESGACPSCQGRALLREASAACAGTSPDAPGAGSPPHAPSAGSPDVIHVVSAGAALLDDPDELLCCGMCGRPHAGVAATPCPTCKLYVVAAIVALLFVSWLLAAGLTRL